MPISSIEADGVRLYVHRLEAPADIGRPRGQALVEFALVLPVMLVLLLATTEAGLLVLRVQGAQQAAVVLADWEALHVGTAGYPDIEAQELGRATCDGTTAITWPDGTQTPGSRVVVSVSCAYHPIATLVWDGMPYSASAAAVLP